jgi:hypothetical protein
MRKLITLVFIGMLGLGLGGCGAPKAGGEEAAPAPEAAVEGEAAPVEGEAAAETPVEEAPAETAEATE